MNIRRGSVYWWRCPQHSRKHIQEGMRPVVVVSNDTCNSSSGVVTVVPFSTKVKRAYPQQVALVFEEGMSIALCDQITSVPVEEIGRYICELYTYQMDQLDTAIAVHLGFVSVEDRPYATFHKIKEVDYGAG